jgi:hypothetical protein
LTQQRTCVHKQISQKKILLHFVIRLKINLLTNCTSLIKCCKSVQSKGNVLFSGLKRLLLRMLFIALLVFYLAVQNFCIYPLNDWSNIHNYIKRLEVLIFHTVSQPLIFLMLSPKRQSRSPFIQCYRLSKKRILPETDIF